MATTTPTADENAAEMAKRVLAMCDAVSESNRRTARRIEESLQASCSGNTLDFSYDDVNDDAARKLEFQGSMIDVCVGEDKPQEQQLQKRRFPREREMVQRRRSVRNFPKEVFLRKEKSGGVTDDDNEDSTSDVDESPEDGNHLPPSEPSRYTSFTCGANSDAGSIHSSDRVSTSLSASASMSGPSIEEQLTQCRQLLVRTRENSALKYRRLEMEFMALKLQLANIQTDMDTKDMQLKMIMEKKMGTTQELGKALDGQDRVVRHLVSDNNKLKERIKEMEKEQQAQIEENERLRRRLEAGGVGTENSNGHGTQVVEMGSFSDDDSSDGEQTTKASGRKEEILGSYDAYGRRNSINSAASVENIEEESEYFYSPTQNESHPTNDRTPQLQTQQSTNSLPTAPASSASSSPTNELQQPSASYTSLFVNTLYGTIVGNSTEKDAASATLPSTTDPVNPPAPSKKSPIPQAAFNLLRSVP